MHESARWKIIQNEGERRFETDLGGSVLAILDYARQGDTLNLVHTGVPPEWQGQGIASALTETALEYARKSNLRVIPSCPYAQDYLHRHPQYRDLVDPGFFSTLRPGY